MAIYNSQPRMVDAISPDLLKPPEMAGQIPIADASLGANVEAQPDPNLINTPTGRDGYRQPPTGAPADLSGMTNGRRYQDTMANPNAPSQWNVDNNQTVQGQVKNIIDANSPLMQQAETRSLQQMNGRGLINSSIAVGAGQAALYDAAMPMATSDAAMYGRAAEANNAQRFDLAKMDKTQGFDIDKMDKNYGFDLGKMDKTQGFDIDKMNKSFEQQTAQLTQKFGYDSALMKLQSDSARETANIQAQYKNLTQASSSAASLMNNASDHIHQIMMNENLDAPAKQAAIDAYNSNLNKAMMLIGSFAGDVDLSTMLSELLA